MLEDFKKIIEPQLTAEEFAALGQPPSSVTIPFKVWRNLTARIESMGTPTPEAITAEVSKQVAQQISQQTEEAINAAVEKRLSAIKAELHKEFDTRLGQGQAALRLHVNRKVMVLARAFKL